MERWLSQDSTVYFSEPCRFPLKGPIIFPALFLFSNFGQGSLRGKGLGGFSLSTFWMVKQIFHFILLTHIHHLQKQLTLHIIKYIKVSVSDKPDISDSLSLVLLLNGRLDFNREIMEFQPVVSVLIRSWIGVSRR